MRKKLQNNKGYAESPEFQPALGLFIRRSPSLQLEVNKIPYNFFCTHTHVYIYITEKAFTSK